MQPTPPPERENVPSLKLLLAGLAAIAIGAAAVVVTWLLMQGWQQAREPIPPTVGSPEIARVNQQPFALDDRYERLWQRQRQRLHSYGWVDREARLIHVPLERALELVLQEQEGAR